MMAVGGWLRAALLCCTAALAASFSVSHSQILARRQCVAGRGYAPGSLLRGLQKSRGARTSRLRMQLQWRDDPERLPFQKQWEAFQAYNLGRWKGRALHLNPETGEYMEPFLTEATVDVILMDEGVQSAKQRVSLATKDGAELTAPRLSESVITVNDEFQSSDDGSYSYDSSLVSLPDVPGTFRFCIEMSLALSREERVRCLALYDFQSKLSRIVLYEEQRIQSTGAQRLIGIKLDEEPSPSARSPLTLLSCLGEFRGNAVGRRVSRLGGGDQRFGSRSDMQWSQNKLRREMQVLDQRNRIVRKTTWGSLDSPAESFVNMDNGHKLLMLPSSCYVYLPLQLETPSAAASVSAEEDSDVSKSADAQAEPADASAAVKRALEAAFSPGAPESESDVELAGVESFAAEFGCFVNDGNEVLRTIRIYTNDGKMAATTTMAEKRAADAKGQGPGLSYDQF